METSKRVYLDCRDFPSENKCTVKISGTPDEVLAIATQHAVSSHGHRDSPELRQALRQALLTEA